jgi:hypothetical protein
MHLALVSIQEKLIACVSARALLTFDLFQAPNFHRARPAPWLPGGDKVGVAVCAGGLAVAVVFPTTSAALHTNILARNLIIGHFYMTSY